MYKDSYTDLKKILGIGIRVQLTPEPYRRPVEFVFLETINRVLDLVMENLRCLVIHSTVVDPK